MTSIFIVGYTGACGQALVKHLARENPFKSIVLIGRRQVQLPVENDGRFEQKIVDFDNLDAHAEAFTGCGVGFCCLGTTRGKAGKDGFIRVDKDYVLNSARVAKSVGCKHFQLITASTSDKNSCLLYNRIKGEVEEGLKDLQFERLSIFRPALILNRGDDNRCGEGLAYCVMFPCIKCCPGNVAAPTQIIAAAMVTNVRLNSTDHVEIINNARIREIGDKDSM